MTMKQGKNNKTTISAKTNLGDLVNKYPELVQVLVEDYGLHCIGCPIAAFESLGDGARGHGMSEQEINVMITRLQHLVKS